MADPAKIAARWTKGTKVAMDPSEALDQVVYALEGAEQTLQRHRYAFKGYTQEGRDYEKGLEALKVALTYLTPLTTEGRDSTRTASDDRTAFEEPAPVDTAIEVSHFISRAQVEVRTLLGQVGHEDRRGESLLLSLLQSLKGLESKVEQVVDHFDGGDAHRVASNRQAGAWDTFKKLKLVLRETRSTLDGYAWDFPLDDGRSAPSKRAKAFHNLTHALDEALDALSHLT